MAAKSTAALVDELAEQDAPVRFACRVPDFDMEPYITRRELRQIDRPTALGLCAAVDAIQDAALPPLPPERVGVHLGTGIGGLPSMEATALHHGADPMGMPVHTVPRTMANSAAGRIAMRYGFQGSCLTYTTACASGTNAIGEAARRIQYGELDAVVTGGFDSAITTIMLSGFARMRALSSRNDAPRPGQPPLRRGPRRLRDGRGRRRPGPGTARCRTRPRRADLRGDRGLRDQLRRVPHRRPPAGRRRGRRLHDPRHRRRRAAHRRHRAHQRARHLHPAQRQRRSRRHRTLLRSARHRP
ncbi:hypothetical protein GCM10020000_02890 [Streptomyces olivoverticillatus]